MQYRNIVGDDATVTRALFREQVMYPTAGAHVVGRCFHAFTGEAYLFSGVWALKHNTPDGVRKLLEFVRLVEIADLHGIHIGMKRAFNAYYARFSVATDRATCVLRACEPDTHIWATTPPLGSVLSMCAGRYCVAACHCVSQENGALDALGGLLRVYLAFTTNKDVVLQYADHHWEDSDGPTGWHLRCT